MHKEHRERRIRRRRRRHSNNKVVIKWMPSNNQSLEVFAKLATALCSRWPDYKIDFSSPIAVAMGFVEIDFLLFAGALHIAVASFAKASLTILKGRCFLQDF
jgi:hypothetical protein